MGSLFFQTIETLVKVIVDRKKIPYIVRETLKVVDHFSGEEKVHGSGITYSFSDGTLSKIMYGHREEEDYERVFVLWERG
jgi:hypothetical protein